MFGVNHACTLSSMSARSKFRDRHRRGLCVLSRRSGGVVAKVLTRGSQASKAGTKRTRKTPHRRQGQPRIGLLSGHRQDSGGRTTAPRAQPQDPEMAWRAARGTEPRQPPNLVALQPNSLAHRGLHVADCRINPTSGVAFRNPQVVHYLWISRALVGLPRPSEVDNRTGSVNDKCTKSRSTQASNLYTTPPTASRPM